MFTAITSPRYRKKILYSCAVLTGVLLSDQLSKFIVLKNNLFPVFYNSTIAFSLPIAWYLPWIFIAGAVSYILFFGNSLSFTSKQVENYFNSKYLWITLPLIGGGGISNVIDRILHSGSVIDFIDLKYWPVFNLADSAIVIGVFLIIYNIFEKRGDIYGKS